MRRFAFAGVLALALAGCGAPSNDTADALTAGLKAAEQTATLYVKLPLCPAQPVCRDRGVAAKIGAADNIANDTLARYRAGKASYADAAAAIAGLTTLFAPPAK